MNAVVHRKRDRCCLHRDHRHFHLPHVFSLMGYLVRFQGKWIEITPKPFEPERMTTDIAWSQIKEGLSAVEAYRKWFERQRKLSRLFQQ